MTFYHDLPSSHNFTQFRNIKVKSLQTYFVEFTCKFVEAVETEELVINRYVSNLDDFILLNNITENMEIVVEVGVIPELTGEHFTNKNIKYRLNQSDVASKIVCENATNLICNSWFSLEGMNLRKYKYDNIVQF